MKDWLLSVVWYGSLLATLLGGLVLLAPLPAIGLTSRSHRGVVARDRHPPDRDAFAKRPGDRRMSRPSHPRSTA